MGLDWVTQEWRIARRKWGKRRKHEPRGLHCGALGHQRGAPETVSGAIGACWAGGTRTPTY